MSKVYGGGWRSRVVLSLALPPAAHLRNDTRPRKWGMHASREVNAALAWARSDLSRPVLGPVVYPV